MGKSARFWLLLFAVLLCASAVFSVVLYLPGRQNTLVSIYANGVLIKEIDLSRVSEPYSFTVWAPNGGSNTILVAPGQISVSQATCPDQICVHQGALPHSAVPIVCLPHRLVIQWNDHGGAIDAQTGGR